MKWISFVCFCLMSSLAFAQSNSVEPQVKLNKKEKLQRNKSQNESPTTKPATPETQYFMLENNQHVPTTLDYEPEYVDGETEKSRIIWMNIRYPAIARNNRIQGQVLITVFLDEKGQMQDAQITKGIGGGCDEEALKVIKLLQPKGFTPAIKDGQPVAVKFDIPVVFRVK